MPRRTRQKLIEEANQLADDFEGAHDEPYVVACDLTGEEVYVEAWVWNEFTGNQDPIAIAHDEPRIKAILIELNGYEPDWPLISSTIRILMERARGESPARARERCTS